MRLKATYSQPQLELRGHIQNGSHTATIKIQRHFEPPPSTDTILAEFCHITLIVDPSDTESIRGSSLWIDMDTRV